MRWHTVECGHQHTGGIAYEEQTPEMGQLATLGPQFKMNQEGGEGRLEGLEGGGGAGCRREVGAVGRGLPNQNQKRLVDSHWTQQRRTPPRRRPRGTTHSDASNSPRTPPSEVCPGPREDIGTQ